MVIRFLKAFDIEGFSNEFIVLCFKGIRNRNLSEAGCMDWVFKSESLKDRSNVLLQSPEAHIPECYLS